MTEPTPDQPPAPGTSGGTGRRRSGEVLVSQGLLTPEQLARVAQVKDRMRELRVEMRQLWQGQQ